MKVTLKLQLTFNEIEYPAALAPLLEMPPHYRSRFCKQVLEMFFRGGGADGTWPVAGGIQSVQVAGMTAPSGKTPGQDAASPLGTKMFDDSYAEYFEDN